MPHTKVLDKAITIPKILNEPISLSFPPELIIITPVKQIIKIRGMDKDILAEEDMLLTTYRDALGLPTE